MMLPDPKDNFHEALRALPAPGGNGYHSALMGVANRGILAGVTPAELFRLIRQHTPQGRRAVPDGEIQDAVEKAARECTRTNWSPRVPPPSGNFDGPAFIAARLRDAEGVGEADIFEASPVRPDADPRSDADVLLRSLYKADDLLFIGATKAAGELGDTIRTRDEWLLHLGAGATPGPQIMPNPLSGRIGRTKTGKPSLRADECVVGFRYAVVEFDGMPRDDQCRFWYSVDLPVVALIDSGGKSLHAWVATDGISTADEWTASVENILFASYLNKLGADSTCRNESRLSRMAGHLRSETNRWQRILYLAPEGRAIHACH